MLESFFIQETIIVIVAAIVAKYVHSLTLIVIVYTHSTVAVILTSMSTI